MYIKVGGGMLFISLHTKIVGNRKMVAIQRLSNFIAPHPWVVGLHLC